MRSPVCRPHCKQIFRRGGQFITWRSDARSAPPTQPLFEGTHEQAVPPENTITVPMRLPTTPHLPISHVPPPAPLDLWVHYWDLLTVSLGYGLLCNLVSIS